MSTTFDHCRLYQDSTLVQSLIQQSIDENAPAQESDIVLRENVKKKKKFLPAPGLVRTDGNCLPDTVAVLLNQRDGDTSADREASSRVRKTICCWLQVNQNFVFQCGVRALDFVSPQTEWSAFCQKMAKDKVWMEGPCLPAIAEIWQRRIHVIWQGTDMIFEPVNRSKSTWFIAWWQERHYSSLHSQPYSIANIA